MWPRESVLIISITWSCWWTLPYRDVGARGMSLTEIMCNTHPNTLFLLNIFYTQRSNSTQALPLSQLHRDTTYIRYYKEAALVKTGLDYAASAAMSSELTPTVEQSLFTVMGGFFCALVFYLTNLKSCCHIPFQCQLSSWHLLWYLVSASVSQQS